MTDQEQPKRVTLLSIIYQGRQPVLIPMAVYTDMALLEDHIRNLTEDYNFDGYESTNETMKQIAAYSKTVTIKGMGEFTQVIWVERKRIDYHDQEQS